MTDAPIRLNEQTLQGAITAMDVTVLTGVLRDGREEEALRLARMIMRSTALMVMRPGDPKAARKAAFLSAMVAAFAAHASDKARAAMEEAKGQLELAGLGYQRILTALAASSCATLSPAERVTNALWRAASQSDSLMRETFASLTAAPYVVAQGMTLRAPNGRRLAPDTLNDSLITIAGATLQMEAITQSWLDGEVIVLPAPTAVTLESLEAMAFNDRTALAWGNWGVFEQTARFLDCPMTLMSEGGRDAFHAPLPADDWIDWACQIRRNDQYDQNLLEYDRRPDIRNAIRPLAASPPLAPDAVLNVVEAFAVGAMSEFLGYAIIDDLEEIAGLRIIEWIRGFAVLAILGEQREAAPVPGDPPRLPLFTEDDLVAALVQGGLSREGAILFIGEALFRKSSSDLYDAPLVRLQDGRLLLFSPAAIGSNIVGGLRSIFARKKVVFEKKGPAFEDLLLQRLQRAGSRHGFEAIAWETGIDSQTYQYDVLLLWGDHLFVFECKNRSVSDGSPVQARHFLRENLRHARQVRRLASALEARPELVSEAFGCPVGPVTVVPVVLNNLTYAREGRHEGVYFQDAGALLRFFNSPAVTAKAALPIGGGRKRLYDLVDVPIWSGSEPTPADLMEQLENPVQLRILRHHTRSAAFRFPLDATTTVVTTEYTRRPQDQYTLAEMTDTTRREVREGFVRAKKKALKDQRKADRKASLAAGRRPWQ